MGTTLRDDEEALSAENQSILSFLEKLRMEHPRCPYRKPTQVDKVRNLRPLRELWLRNSANYIRNFGRRMASRSDEYTLGASWRLQIPGGSDCLPKT